MKDYMLMLPMTEMRNFAYEHCILKDAPLELYHASTSRSCQPHEWLRTADAFALTQANRQIRSEFLIIYYMRTEFQIAAQYVKKFSAIIDKILMPAIPLSLRIDIPYTGPQPGLRGSPNARGQDALPVVNFARKHPNYRITFCRNTQEYEPVLSAEEKEAWELVVSHNSPLYRKWLQDRSIKELCIYKDGAKFLVLRHQAVEALKQRLWLDQSHPVIRNELLLPNTRLGIYYG
jgi:hypothetical protein